MTIRRLVTLALLLALIPLPVLADGAPPCTPGPLRILLTNDDGSTAPGIRALLTSLREAGHDVTMVAPATDQSGRSVSLTFSTVAVTQDPTDAKVFAAAGTPATTVLLGITGILGPANRPDLVVSGINDGANLGPATVISGTVGATIAAIQSLEPPIPAIAISTDRRVTSEPVNSPINLAHFAQVAEFLARLVESFQVNRCRGGELLPEGVALNVNYPPRAVEDVRGVVVAEQGQANYFTIAYTQVAPGVFAPAFGAAPPSPDVKHSDTVWFGDGYITVVPLDGNYTAPHGAAVQVRRALKRLEP